MTTSPVLVLVPGVTGERTDGEPFAVAEEQAPQLLVTDFGATRGDGVFETIGVFGGRALNLEPHLERLQRSAAMLDLSRPDADVVRAAFELAVATHESVAEMMVRIIHTRGLETTGEPTCWIHAKASPDFSAERAGVKVAALDRGLASTVASTSPWLLAGSKSTSYAVNMAALREAERRGKDDVLFVSTDGFALEGPTSTLLVRSGERFLTTPASAGVLPGTTITSVGELLVGERGQSLDEELMELQQVKDSDGAWLLSSGRLVAPILEIDDSPLPQDPELTAAMSAHLSFGVVGGA